MPSACAHACYLHTCRTCNVDLTAFSQASLLFRCESHALFRTGALISGREAVAEAKARNVWGRNIKMHKQPRPQERPTLNSAASRILCGCHLHCCIFRFGACMLVVSSERCSSSRRNASTCMCPRVRYMLSTIKQIFEQVRVGLCTCAHALCMVFASACTCSVVASHARSVVVL